MKAYDATRSGLEKSTPSHVKAKLAVEWVRLMAPLLARHHAKSSRTFCAFGQTYAQLSHPANTTWRNERAVEVPVALDFVKGLDGARILEFGNVLTQYGCVRERDVVDKYEVARGVMNIDIFDVAVNCQYDGIVSISTIEHVGWDESPRRREKSIEVIDHLRSLLKPNGRMLLSAPLGWNPGIDETVLSRRSGAERETVLVRSEQGWRESAPVVTPYIGGSRGASAVWFGLFRGRPSAASE